MTSEVEMFAGWPTVRYRVWARRKHYDDEFTPTNTCYVYKPNAEAYAKNQLENDFWESEVREEPY